MFVCQQRPFLAISREIIKHFLFLCMSPLHGWWCDVLGSVCIKFLNTSDLLRWNPLVMVTLPTSLFVGSFPLIPASPGQYTHKSFWSWMQNTDTHKSGLLISFYTFHKKVIEDEILCLMDSVVCQNRDFLALKTCRHYQHFYGCHFWGVTLHLADFKPRQVLGWLQTKTKPGTRLTSNQDKARYMADFKSRQSRVLGWL